MNTKRNHENTDLLIRLDITDNAGYSHILHAFIPALQLDDISPLVEMVLNANGYTSYNCRVDEIEFTRNISVFTKDDLHPYIFNNQENN